MDRVHAPTVETGWRQYQRRVGGGGALGVLSFGGRLGRPLVEFATLSIFGTRPAVQLRAGPRLQPARHRGLLQHGAMRAWISNHPTPARSRRRVQPCGCRRPRGTAVTGCRPFTRRAGCQRASQARPGCRACRRRAPPPPCPRPCAMQEWRSCWKRDGGQRRGCTQRFRAQQATL